MNIIEARPIHAQRILELERRCFSEPWTMANILSSMANGGFFLAALSGDEIRGYISVSAVLDEGHIGNVAVAPEYRREGVGEALVLSAIERGAKLGLSFLTLEVRQSNAAATALYAKCGFKRVGVRRGYYTSPKEDAVLMTRFL